MAEPAISISSATEQDCSTVLQFIRELAAYEKLSHEVVATEADLRTDLFGATLSRL